MQPSVLAAACAGVWEAGAGGAVTWVMSRGFSPSAAYAGELPAFSSSEPPIRAYAAQVELCVIVRCPMMSSPRQVVMVSR